MSDSFRVDYTPESQLEAVLRIGNPFVRDLEAQLGIRCLVLPGAPRTKKNHSRLVWAGGKPRVLPSAQWKAWLADVRAWYLEQPVADRRRLPDCDYNCRALFFRDIRAGDAVGYYQGLADLLEELEVLSDDKLIVSWDGSRLLYDRATPRVELILTTAVN